MITPVILRHEALRRLPKLLLITLATASLVFNLIAFYDRGRPDPGGIMSGWDVIAVQLCVYLCGSLLLLMPEGGRRCPTCCLRASTSGAR